MGITFKVCGTRKVKVNFSWQFPVYFYRSDECLVMVHECVNTVTQEAYRRCKKCPVRNKSVLHACTWQSSHLKEVFPLLRKFSATKRFSEEGNIVISSIYIYQRFKAWEKSQFTNEFIQKLSRKIYQHFKEISFSEIAQYIGIIFLFSTDHQLKPLTKYKYPPCNFFVGSSYTGSWTHTLPASKFWKVF